MEECDSLNRQAGQARRIHWLLLDSCVKTPYSLPHHSNRGNIDTRISCT